MLEKLRRLGSIIRLTNPDATICNVVQDAHTLADQEKKDTVIIRDGIKVEVAYHPGGTRLKSVQIPKGK